MTNWHRTRRGDLGLRASGIGACALSYAAIAHLPGSGAARGLPGAGTYALATVGFLSASVGGLLVSLGGQLFDAVEISERWRMTSINDADPDLREDGGAVALAARPDDKQAGHER